ncbi:MAG: universal stress protein, partial [Planctomycetaceae bacterium]|nr:universal stress protein [Planctomycetaceae bacterium]
MNSQAIFPRMMVALSATEEDVPLVTYARLLARAGLVHHVSFVHVRTPARIMDDPRPDAGVLQTCEDVVATHFARPRENVTVGCHVVLGVRIDALIDFATQDRCDVILLGHHSRRSGQRSLARRLAMIAPCSVWLVPEGAPLSIFEILVPIDFSDHAADSLSVAVSIARAVGLTECSATYVFADPSMVRYDDHIDEIRHNVETAFEEFIEPIDRRGMAVEPTYMEGNNVGKTLLHSAKLNGTDLLVMNTRGRSRSASILLGSVTGQVLSESPVAVLAVKHYGAMMNLFQALKQSQFWAR